ncbi:MAG: aminomethyl-transferring glycine dehydrogenase subunit GcvPA [Dehalococcoidia bacterium]|nr:aminomethyl-transferring glycine dehydrogenase subunit GcvPA [Dehalococcoidia bacterium]
MDNPSTFSPYVPNTEADRQAILQAIGVASVQELFGDIPRAFRNPALNIPAPLSELELMQEFEALAAENRHAFQGPCFLGAGAYRHFIPAVVQAIASRGEFLTAYTPYQPEVSQGTLQVIYELQSLTCQLFDMDVSNAGMYDGATSLAEAALMACRITHRYRVACLDTLSPLYRQVLETYARPQGVEVYTVSPGTSVPMRDDTACLVAQHPNFFGYLEDLSRLEQEAHKQGALLVVSTDPIAMGMFRAPGSYGADMVTAEGQPLGIPVSFGGPYIGLFSCKSQYVRQMPGRIVGRTVDGQGRTGYVLTLQTREQHIRRERATSNICTSEALMGLMATVYLATVGKQGLRQVAELCYQKAHYAASLIQRIPGYSLHLRGAFFQEFVVRCPRPPAEINAALLNKGIVGGLDVSEQIPNGLLLCVTEMNSRQEIEALVRALAEVA